MERKTLTDLIEAMVTRLDRAERTIKMIDCMTSMKSFNEHARMKQIQTVLEYYYRQEGRRQ